MRLPLTQAKQIHTVRGGYYFRNDNDMLYWFPSSGKKQLIMIYCPASDWDEVRREK